MIGLRQLKGGLLVSDRYELVLLLVVVTYVVSIAVTEVKAASIVLTVQVATVWLALRTSQAGKVVRLCLYRVCYDVHVPRSCSTSLKSLPSGA